MIKLKLSMRILRWLLLTALLVLGTAIISYHELIISYYNKKFGEADTRPIVAKVSTPEGKVRHKLPKQLIYKNAFDGLELRAQDTITTDQNSSLNVVFNDGLELLVEENSMIVIDKLGGGSRGEGFKISFLRGNFKVINPGKSGVSTLIKSSPTGKEKEDIVIDPAGRLPAKPIVIQAKRDANFEKLIQESRAKAAKNPIPEDLIAEPVNKPILTSAESNIDSQKLKADDNNKIERNKIQRKEEKETLPDNYIVDSIKKQKPFFNRCYAQHLRLNPEAQGKIDFSFTISPQGKVVDVRVLRSSIADTRLQQCSMSVIERIEFRPFRGDPIVVNYPIQYE